MDEPLVLHPPSQIEGESSEVAAAVREQLRNLAVAGAAIMRESFVQLRAAGIDTDSATPESDWLASEEGRTVEDMLWAMRTFVDGARKL